MRPGVRKIFANAGIADAQAAGIGAERRHHGALAVAGKTAPLHRCGRGWRRAPWDADGRRFRPPRRSAHGGTRCGRSRLRSRPRRRDRTAAPDRDCPKSRSSRAAPASPRARRGRAPTAAHARRGRESCRRARSPCAGRAARSRRRAGSASPPCHRAAAARRARRSWSLFPDAGRRRRAGAAPARTARRRDRRGSVTSAIATFETRIMLIIVPKIAPLPSRSIPSPL